MTAVLDASALLALVLDERGGARVLQYVGSAAMSTVNYAEVLAKLGDGGLPYGIGENLVESLQIQIVPFTEMHAVRTAGLRRTTSHRGLSFGDRACLALAGLTAATAVTADRAWRDLDVGVDVVVVR